MIYLKVRVFGGKQNPSKAINQGFRSAGITAEIRTKGAIHRIMFSKEHRDWRKTLNRALNGQLFALTQLKSPEHH